MMRFIMILAILLAITSNGLAGPTVDGEIRILELVEALKSPDYQQRSDAMATLKSLGQPAYTLLKQVVTASNSPEQVWRAKEILSYFEEQRLDASMLAATMIQLPEGTMTLGEALQTLQQDADTHFAANNSKLFQQTITLPKSTPMPYWEAFALLAKLAQVHLVETDIVARATLTKLAKPNASKEVGRDPRLIAVSMQIENAAKAIKSLEAELAGQPANTTQLLQKLAVANQVQMAYQQQLKVMEQQIANERRQAELTQRVYALESGPSLMVQTVGNLRLSLNPLIKSKGELPLRIAIDSEPNVIVNPIESVQIDHATDAQGLALKSETHIEPMSQLGELGSTVIVNNGVPIAVNGQIVIRNNGGGNIIINQRAGGGVPQVGAESKSMVTLSGFVDSTQSISSTKGSLRVPITRAGVTLAEINSGERGLREGDSGGQPGIGVKLTQVKKQDSSYIIEFDLNYRPTELAWRVPGQREVRIAVGIAVFQPAVPQGAGVPLPQFSHINPPNPTLQDDVVFSDAQGVLYKLAIPIDRVTRATSTAGMTHDHVKMTLATTQPNQGPPTKMTIIGHRSRTVTVPFEFKNPTIGK